MKLVWKFGQQPPTVKSALVTVGVLAATQLLLSAALVWVMLRPRPVVIVPGVPTQMVSTPETIPLGAARKFALLYLSYFDDYTPASIEERSNLVLKYVTAENMELAAKSLSDRASYVVRAREASQLVLPLPTACEAELMGAGLVQVRLLATKRTYIAGSLKEERKIQYTLLLRTAQPTDDDPYGFVIARQSVEPIETADPKTDRGREVSDAVR